MNRAQRGVAKKIGHTHDSVQRGPYLMAHVGHELGLQSRCLDGRGEGFLLVGDVGGDTADDGAALVLNGKLHREEGAITVRRLHRLLERHGDARPQQRFIAGSYLRDEVGGADLGIEMAHDLLRRHRADVFELVIDKDVAPIGVLDVDGGVCIVEDALKPGIRALQRHFTVLKRP